MDATLVHNVLSYDVLLYTLVRENIQKAQEKQKILNDCIQCRILFLDPVWSCMHCINCIIIQLQTKDPDHSVADKSAAEGTSSTNNPVDMSLVWFTYAIKHQHKILYTFSMCMF